MIWPPLPPSPPLIPPPYIWKPVIVIEDPHIIWQVADQTFCASTRGHAWATYYLCVRALSAPVNICVWDVEKETLPQSSAQNNHLNRQMYTYVRMHICFCSTQFVSPAAFTKKKLPRAFRIGANMKSNVDYEPIIPAHCQTDRWRTVAPRWDPIFGPMRHLRIPIQCGASEVRCGPVVLACLRNCTIVTNVKYMLVRKLSIFKILHAYMIAHPTTSPCTWSIGH